MTHTECTILKHKVEFKAIPTSGYIAVGIDGRLVGNYENDAAAIVAALEHVRVVDGLMNRPMLPGRVRSALREMAAEWYWLDGVPYCPACVEADDPCMGDEERERATRSPRSQWSCRCACCGEQS